MRRGRLRPSRPTSTASSPASTASRFNATSAAVRRARAARLLQGAVQGGGAGAPAPAPGARRLSRVRLRRGARDAAPAPPPRSAGPGCAIRAWCRPPARRVLLLAITGTVRRSQSQVLGQAQRTLPGRDADGHRRLRLWLDRVVVPRPRRLPGPRAGVRRHGNCKGGRLVNVRRAAGAYLVPQDATAIASRCWSSTPATRSLEAPHRRVINGREIYLGGGPGHLDRRLPRPRPRLCGDLGPGRGLADPHGDGRLPARRPP